MEYITGEWVGFSYQLQRIHFLKVAIIVTSIR